MNPIHAIREQRRQPGRMRAIAIFLSSVALAGTTIIVTDQHTKPKPAFGPHIHGTHATGPGGGVITVQ